MFNWHFLRINAIAWNSWRKINLATNFLKVEYVQKQNPFCLGDWRTGMLRPIHFKWRHPRFATRVTNRQRRRQIFGREEFKSTKRRCLRSRPANGHSPVPRKIASVPSGSPPEAQERGSDGPGVPPRTSLASLAGAQRLTPFPPSPLGLTPNLRSARPTFALQNAPAMAYRQENPHLSLIVTTLLKVKKLADSCS